MYSRALNFLSPFSRVLKYIQLPRPITAFVQKDFVSTRHLQPKTKILFVSVFLTYSIRTKKSVRDHFRKNEISKPTNVYAEKSDKRKYIYYI